MQKARSQTYIVLELLVGKEFQVLFHCHLWVLITFPSQYSSTIGHQLVFSLRGWSPYIHTEYLLRITHKDSYNYISISYKGLLPSMVQLSRWFY